MPQYNGKFKPHEQHPHWKGDAAGYHAKHTRAIKAQPILSVCIDCGAQAIDRHREDYHTDEITPLCRRCHMIRDGRTQYWYGIRNARFQLDDIFLIYELHAQGYTNTEIAQFAQVTSQAISKILTGRRWAYAYEIFNTA